MPWRGVLGSIQMQFYRQFLNIILSPSICSRTQGFAKNIPSSSYMAEIQDLSFKNVACNFVPVQLWVG